MREIEYPKKDGSTGVKYKLEAGDKFVSKFEGPKTFEGGQFPRYSIGVVYKEQDMYVELTKAQNDQIVKMGNVTNQELEAYEYENQYGKQVGVGKPKEE